ncbi:MAG: hypothetical protein HGA86_07545 [Anaerolineaceae bacterium]|nr:hypothetical protein [Anaerolineaceae bacterium]
MSNTQAVPSPVPSDINSASTQHVLPNPDLKRKPKWIFLAVGGVGILIMVIIGLIFLQGRNAARNNKLSANATQVPIVANSKEGPSLTNKNYDEAMKLINQATDQLQQGQPGRAMITFQKLNNLGLVDNKVFDDAMSQFYQQKNWTAAAMFLFSTSSGEMLEIAKTKLEMVHEILYLAAEQKDADQIFSKLPDRPIFVVSKIRHELYYGDPATAKRQLGDVLGKPALLKESPEAKTLEVEIFIKLNDLANAKKKLQPLLNDTSLPVWVQGVVDELNKKIKS